LPQLPDTVVDTLTKEYGLTTKDAGTLLTFEDGARLDYFHDVLHHLQEFGLASMDKAESGRVVGNW
jgi:aspartyl-tRNA(Asn)/glutamyl-tRNA(Gln) amidotransferase subunit B